MDNLPATYEAAFAELQAILRDLQDDTVSVDDLAAKVARAGVLIQFCRERLRTAEAALGEIIEK